VIHVLVAVVCLSIAASSRAQTAAPPPTAAAPNAASAPGPAPAPEGAHATPSLYWKDGPHRVDVGLAARVRMEGWDTFSSANPDWDWFTGTRLRLSLRYLFADQLAVFVEGQYTTVHGLDADLGAPVRSYLTTTGLDSDAHGTSLRQAYLEVRPAKGTALRGGRQDVKLGTDVVYPEPNWKYLKTARIGERLVGTVGWTHVERSYDAATLAVDTGPTALYAFVGRPTTGVFDVDSAYRPQHDLVLGGATFTAKRDAWLPHTELGAFAIAYEDERPTTRGGIAGGVDVTTLGGYSLGVYPLGPAQLDAIAWFAGQTGKYGGQHHGAYAGIFEAGVQLPEVFAKPWLRLGINLASGDSDPGDGRHETFFNLLPTNHIYYGFADQLAFQNLKNLFVQLRLAPHERIQLNGFVHYFSLMEANDARYSGSGAFATTSFGFTASPSGGARSVGVEYDLVATVALHRALTLELGAAHLDAGRVLAGDVDFLYASLEAKY
jgi:hypothetical protein